MPLPAGQARIGLGVEKGQTDGVLSAFKVKRARQLEQDRRTGSAGIGTWRRLLTLRRVGSASAVIRLS